MGVLILRSSSVVGGGGSSGWNPPAPTYYISTTGSDSNPGTLAQPWAITALWTKASTYAGLCLQIQDGTYSGYNGGIYNSDDYAYYIPSTAAGTSGARTTIRGQTARGAVLTGTGGGILGATAARIGLYINAAYVTVTGLEFRAIGHYGCFTNADNVRVEYCVSHDISRPTYTGESSDNTCGFRTDGAANNFYLGNCYAYDINNGAHDNNECGLEMYDATNGVIEYCEFTGMHTGIFPKDNCGGVTLRYNYVHDVHTCVLYGTNAPAFSLTVRNNVFVGWTSGSAYNRDNLEEASGSAIFNNTAIITASCEAGFHVGATSGNTVDFYNNLIYRNGGSSSGYADTTFQAAAGMGVVDYNMYGTASTFQVPASTSRTFATWKSTLGKDANAINANPTFASGGTGPYAYKLGSGSNGINGGKTGGTSGGSTVNCGAFESSGQTEQIGCDWRGWA